MKAIIAPNRPKLIIFPVFILIMLFFSACRIILVPNYDDKIAVQIENVSKSIDKFWLTMLEMTTEANDGRAYSKFVEQYITIEVELQSLLNKNKMRVKNENSVKICEKTISLFEKYKNEHKQANTISDTDIKLNLNNMRRMLNPLMISEKAKKIAE